MNQILKELGVKEINLGSCIGGDKWIDNSDSSFIESFNPANGELLAKVKLCSENDYESVINNYESGNIIMLAIKRGNNKLVMAFTLSD